MAGGLLGGSGRGSNGRYRPMAEINITPMVDVMLVLLIIFMVTAPLLTSSVNVDLPKTEAAPTPQDDQPLTVSVRADGQVWLQDQQIELGDLVAKLQAIAQNKTDKKIFVRGDKDNSYGRMLEVMGTIYKGGFTKVALLTDPGGARAPAASGTKPAGAASSAPAPGASAPKPAAAAAPATIQGLGTGQATRPVGRP